MLVKYLLKTWLCVSREPWALPCPSLTPSMLCNLGQVTYSLWTSDKADSPSAAHRVGLDDFQGDCELAFNQRLRWREQGQGTSSYQDETAVFPNPGPQEKAQNAVEPSESCPDGLTRQLELGVRGVQDSRRGGGGAQGWGWSSGSCLPIGAGEGPRDRLPELREVGKNEN